jgi:uncharacterized protein
MDATSKVEAARSIIRARGSALVAFSAGVDSTLVLFLAHEQLGQNAVALTAVSPSMAAKEQEQARLLAEQIGVQHLVLYSSEVENPAYARNSTDRCYFCKTELYDLCEQKRVQLGLSSILDGFNADDLHDYRPGQKAAREHSVVSPLADAGLTKQEVRESSRHFGLATWDKPQTPCLSSRIPYGTSVTPERLAQIEAAEEDLRRLGFRNFRVRYHNEIARLEISSEEYDRFVEPQVRKAINAALRQRGFAYVAVDLEPFRSGRLNEAANLRSPPDLPPATK